MVPPAENPVRRGRPRSIETERAILESAYDLMASEGSGAATIDAIARLSGTSKVTIYKWWPSREALLIDAFMRRAATMLPLGERGDPIARIQDHAALYAEALTGTFGRVQLAVISECIGSTGSPGLFVRRYLAIRRDAAIAIIADGQDRNSIRRSVPAGDLYDRIYGTLFYQFLFGFRALSPDYARDLVASVLQPE